MARPGSFDRGVLADLIRSGRYHSHAELAAVLSEVTGKPVPPARVANALYEMRTQEEYADLSGFAVQHGQSLVAQLEQNTGRKVPPAHKMAIELRRLRQISRLRRGGRVGTKSFDEESRVRRFESDLRDKKYVVDLDSEGRPYCRPAYPHELDTAGYIMDIIALPSP